MKVTRFNRFLLPATVMAATVLATGCDAASSEPSGQLAAVMCEGFVKKRLKSPGTAEFSGVTETKIETLSGTDPWKYKVTAWVDSQNSFGGVVRNPYRCTISTSGKADSDGNRDWTLDDLRFTKPQ